VAQKESIQAQAPQDAEKDALAAKEINCLAGNPTDLRCQAAAVCRLASAAS
jgi:hypothetical protein